VPWTLTNGYRVCVLDEDFTEKHTTVAHELVHARLAERGMKLPVWLGEGFCDFVAGSEHDRLEMTLSCAALDKLGDVPKYVIAAVGEVASSLASSPDWRSGQLPQRVRRGPRRGRLPEPAL
jgi:hypothetical protein